LAKIAAADADKVAILKVKIAVARIAILHSNRVQVALAAKTLKTHARDKVDFRPVKEAALATDKLERKLLFSAHKAVLLQAKGVEVEGVEGHSDHVLAVLETMG
jgi:hypothetical protein